MQIESVVFAAAVLVSILRYLLSWLLHTPYPEPDLAIGILALATALKFGEKKGEQLKRVLNALRTKFFAEKKNEPAL